MEARHQRVAERWHSLHETEGFVVAHWDFILPILKRNWFMLQEVKDRYPKGPRTTPERAKELFDRIYLHFHSLVSDETPPPHLRYAPFLKDLGRKALIFCFIIASLVVVLSLIVIRAYQAGILSQKEGLFLLLPVCSLLYLPLPIYRRTRANMEHSCCYMREHGRGYVVMRDLREGPFLSFCAHEMAHHFLRERGKTGALWEEGWARGIQLKVSEIISQQYQIDALTPALALVVGELREALGLTKRGRALPAWVRKVKSPFHAFALIRWIKGEPGCSKKRLRIHALGTALFALLNELCGERVFKEFLEDPYWSPSRYLG